jgi:uncharacterized surface protein with fasciclin (FAS1) repeats
MKNELMKFRTLLLVLGLTSMIVVSCDKDEDMDELPPASVMEVIASSSNHTTLRAALQASGLDAVLRGSGPFTVFAPTDAAFAALPAGTIESLLADPDGLSDVLLYHVVGGSILSTMLSDNMKASTVSGKELTVTLEAGAAFINNARVTTADIQTQNGVVHVIDAVLIPEPGLPATVVDIVSGSAIHTTLTAAVVAAGLVETLQGEGPFTVFAPTDAAFAALPAGTVEALLADPSGDLTNILIYHVVGAKAMSSSLTDGQEITTVFGEMITVTINAQGVFINDAMVTVADLEAENGVVHIIDAVLLPPSPKPATVVDIVTGSADHATLTAAVVAAGLVETLQGEGPFTVFAPTDDAFAALPEGTIDALLADPSGDLTDILLYHVVGAKAMSSSLTDGQEITTVFGEKLTVTINAQGVFINDAMVTLADLEAENGVVHVIDKVLLP